MAIHAGPNSGLHARTRWHRAGCFSVLALLLASCASATHSRHATAQDYAGGWAYAQSCGMEHSARLDLEAAGDGRVNGLWNDGTRVSGESGRVSGRVNGDRLDLNFCADEEADCPLPTGRPDAFLRREGQKMAWYRSSGDRHDRYLILHPVRGEASPPLDTSCNDAASAND